LGFRIQLDNVELFDDTGNHLIVVFDELQLAVGGSRSAKASGSFISRCCRWVRTGRIRGRGLSVIVIIAIPVVWRGGGGGGGSGCSKVSSAFFSSRESIDSSEESSFDVIHERIANAEAASIVTRAMATAAARKRLRRTVRRRDRLRFV
jgi:hypothetical protein